MRALALVCVAVGLAACSNHPSPAAPSLNKRPVIAPVAKARQAGHTKYRLVDFVTSGPLFIGETLQASTGNWSNTPTSFTYQWQDCDSSGGSCSNISGATNRTYVIQSGDAGHKIVVVVTAVNGSGSASNPSVATPLVPGGGSPCTVTTTSTAAVNGDIAPDAVVCVAASTVGGTATYSGFTLTTSATSGHVATVEARPGDHINIGSIAVESNHIKIHGFYATGGIFMVPPNTSTDLTDISVDHNDVTNGAGGYGVQADCNQSPQPGCQSLTITGNRIHNLVSTATCGNAQDGDAIRIDGTKDVTITFNEEFGVLQGGPEAGSCPTGNFAHSDSMQAYNNNVSTSGITFDHNYFHDNETQGFFLKDGDWASGVVITDNLWLRDTDCCGEGEITGPQIAMNSVGIQMHNNTSQGTTGTVIRALGTTSSPTITYQRNVSDSTNEVGADPVQYAQTCDHNIYTGASQNVWCAGTGDGTTATFTNTSIDDYRIVTNPNNIGVDWYPGQYTYGP